MTQILGMDNKEGIINVVGVFTDLSFVKLWIGWLVFTVHVYLRIIYTQKIRLARYKQIVQLVIIFIYI